MEATWSSFEDEFEQAGSLAAGLGDGHSLDDNLQSTMQMLKEQIAVLASSVKDYSAVTKSLQVRGFCDCFTVTLRHGKSLRLNTCGSLSGQGAFEWQAVARGAG